MTHTKERETERERRRREREEEARKEGREGEKKKGKKGKEKNHLTSCLFENILFMRMYCSLCIYRNLSISQDLHLETNIF